MCLTADDEKPNRKTEPKIPLWSCTNDGGFYWAGAYANDKYVMVTTDDGYSGYSHNTGKLLIFDKRTGELTDSKTTYTGDLRSNVAYDKASGRIFFTSKGGAMYSEIVGADGKIDRSASKTVALGGMSTSTPVVCNGRAYVGVAGTGGQFTPYGGHHIAVIDLTDWKVAYTAQTQGYPQTSGLMTTGYDDGVYVYFMDNYTPGVMRVIHDAPGQTALEGGVTEEFTSDKGVSGTYTDCAPVVFTPRGSLAQYCIGSPVTDEYGTLYFKNDSGNLIALTSAVRELKVAEEPEIARTEDGQWEVTGGKIVAVLLAIALSITGIYDFVVILKDNDSGHRVTVNMKSELTEWLAEHLDHNDLILTPEYSINEVTMSGVMMYMGWPYYAWSAGYDTYDRAAKAKEIYRSTDAEAIKNLVKQEKITYVLYEAGMQYEQEACREDTIASAFTLVYESEDGRIRIYET